MSSYIIQVKKPALDFERRGECDDPARLDEMLIGAIDELRQIFPAKTVRQPKPASPRTASLAAAPTKSIASADPEEKR
ncbi:MAG: hypothetical protein NDJ92_20920 [Thermoanaerobaculia bacterium]|jgi:hypothetical protein|nr:hypothetical protein [Thermoanaerobaculia bacterium]